MRYEIRVDGQLSDTLTEVFPEMDHSFSRDSPCWSGPSSTRLTCMGCWPGAGRSTAVSWRCTGCRSEHGLEGPDDLTRHG